MRKGQGEIPVTNMTNAAIRKEFQPAQDASPKAAGDSIGVLVLGPDDRCRNAVASAAEGPLCSEPRQLPFYPEAVQVAKVIEMAYEVIVVELDSNPEQALEVVEALCAADPALTVMVYSSSCDSDLTIRSMRAGAREFLTLPVAGPTVAKALNRAAKRRGSLRTQKSADC